MEQPIASRRAADRAVARWRQAWHHDGLPTLSRVMSAQDDLQLGPHCFLLKEDSEPEYSVFIHCGGELSSHMIGDVLRQTVAGLSNMEIRKIFSRGVDQTAGGMSPFHQEGRFRHPDGTEVRYRSVFMPVLPDRDGFLGYIFGILRGKSFAPVH